MAEPQSIVLNKRYGGMTSDEYVGGSFFYGENIDPRSNSKSFKLSNRLSETIMNYRSYGYYNSLFVDYSNTEILGVSQDGYIEGRSHHFEGAATGANEGGYLYKVVGSYKNGIRVGNYIFAPYVEDGSGDNNLTVLNIASTYSHGYGLRGANLITTPDLTANTGRTVGAGRTTGAGGAVHTPGNTASLEQSTPAPGVGTGRFSIYIGAWTAGTLTVEVDGVALGKIAIQSGAQQNKRYTFNTDTSSSDPVELIPSTDFDGTVKYVAFNKYDDTKIKDISLTIATYRPMLAAGDFVYIGSGNKIEYIDMSIAFSSRDALDALTLQPGDDIIGLTLIGDVINIYCNNGQDGIKYIWNRVDENPAEKIIRKNKRFISVDGDGNQDYVIVGSDVRRHLYITNGYSKQEIIQSAYMTNYGVDSEAYRLQNRFDFNKVVGFNGDNVLISSYYGVYSYGTKIPGLNNSITKEWANYGALEMSYINGMTYLNRPYLSYRTTSKSRNYNIIGGVIGDNYTDSGYLITSPLIFDNLGTEKLLRKARIGYLSGGSNGTINIYLRANDNTYYTFYVSGLSVTPTAGAIYEYGQMDLEVIKTNIVGGAGTISCIATAFNIYNMPSSGTITKASGTGDASINYTDIDNFILIKTITNSEQKYANEYIIGEDFIGIKLPEVIYKLQLKIELLTSSSSFSPEIFDIPVLSDIVENEF